MLAGYADGLPDVEAGAPATRGSSSFEPCLVSGVVAAAMVTEAAATAQQRQQFLVVDVYLPNPGAED